MYICVCIYIKALKQRERESNWGALSFNLRERRWQSKVTCYLYKCFLLSLLRCDLSLTYHHILLNLNIPPLFYSINPSSWYFSSNIFLHRLMLMKTFTRFCRKIDRLKWTFYVFEIVVFVIETIRSICVQEFC